MPPIEFMLLWLMALLLCSAVLSHAAIRYALWRGMLDHAGQRRSHAGSVPRGGGIAIVLSMLLASALLWGGAWLDDGLLWRLVAGGGLVAAIGWLDDHRPQPVWTRLLVHLVAAGLLVLPSGPGWAIAVLAVLALMAAINFWNFMDGIDGIASLQAIFVAALLVHAFWVAGEAGLTLFSMALLAACIGFLPFNFPRARIFLGDVGSGALGFAVAALLLLAVQRGVLDVWTALLLPVAFWLDAGLTLFARIVLGRRWYTAHREHLYQWLVRRGRSHAQVDALLLGWNLLIVLPAYLLISGDHASALPTLGIVAVLGAAGWWAARRQLLRSARLYGFR